MTTIVYDGNFLAAERYSSVDAHEDRYVCRSCQTPAILVRESNKLSLLRSTYNDVEIIAAASVGAKFASDWVRQCLVRKYDPKIVYQISKSLLKTDRGQGGLILLTEKGVKLIALELDQVYIKDYPNGKNVYRGSGAPFARVAIETLGMDIFQAIRFASLHDPASGGQIDYISMKEYHETKHREIKEYVETPDNDIEKAVNDFKKFLAKKK